MSGYVEKALKWFNHSKPKKKQDQPHEHAPSNYGAKQQFIKQEDESTPQQEEEQYVRHVLGTFLFHVRGVDDALIMSLSAIAGEQAKPTKKMLGRIKQLLDYIAIQKEAVLTYQGSDMILTIHSDALYLSEGVS